jgi:tetratricopeptide (TPR) repeat protein
MSLKAELQTWAAALKAYDEEDFQQSLELFSGIADSSKILANMGLIYATLGEHETAVEQFIAATQLDKYLAVAYFQCGVSNFLLGRYERSSSDFESALLYLRGNESINYTQLGLAFTLFSAEVLFNKGLSLIYLGQTQEGMTELEDASRQQSTEEHSVIDEAIRDRGEGYTVFSIPVGVLYRPSENKLRNAKTRDFLGKAKLVATENPNEAYTAFTGVTRLKQGVSPQNVFLDRDREEESSLTRSATLNRLKGPDLDVQPVGTLARAKTTINVAPNARERIMGGTVGADASQPSSLRGNDPPPATVVARSNTTAITGRVGQSGLPIRALTVRKPVAGDVSPASASPKPKTPGDADFYEGLVDSYAQPSPPPKVPQTNNDRIANWARNNMGGPPLSRAPSAFGGSSRSGTIRRRVTRRTIAPSIYDDEEEGYMTGSGEYDELYELMKIRVKIHCDGDVRGMALDPAVPFAEFKQRVAAKFETSPQSIMLKFRDEDGGKVTLRDESDYELAIETARESAKGRPEGKLEVWCEMK